MYRPDPLRWAVVSRLRIAGRLHSRHVQDRIDSGATALARHAVMFCYHVPESTRPDNEISLASRLFSHDDIAEITHGRHDLSTVLRTLHARADEFLRAGRFDPRHHLATHLDPGLAHDHGRGGPARFVGVATSTLHTSGPTARSHLDPAPRTAWTALARLVDGTALTVHTPDLTRTAAPLDVESTHNLARTDNDSVLTQQPWSWAHTRHRLRGLDDTDSTDTRAALDQLHDLIADPAGHRGSTNFGAGHVERTAEVPAGIPHRRG